MNQATTPRKMAEPQNEMRRLAAENPAPINGTTAEAIRDLKEMYRTMPAEARKLEQWAEIADANK